MSEERIEVSFGKSGSTKVFETLQELESWFVKEQSFWSWLSNPPNSEAKQVTWQRYGSFFGNVQQQINEAKRIKRQYEQQNQPPPLQQQFTNIKAYFKQCFEQGFCSHSGTPLAKFVEQYRPNVRFISILYPERFAQEALGHNSKAVRRAYAKRALMKLPSLQEYEEKADMKTEMTEC